MISKTMAAPLPQDSAVRASPGTALYPGGGKAELAQTLSSLTAFARQPSPQTFHHPGAEPF